MRSLQIVIAALAVCSFHAYADCAAPQAPGKIPDGAKATLEEMVAGKKALTQYDADVKAFSACIDDEAQKKIDTIGPKATAETEQKIAMIKLAAAKMQNAEVDKLQAYANKFNEQVRAYKANQAKN